MDPFARGGIAPLFLEAFLLQPIINFYPPRMHTVTSKLILTPLAEAVFQLILIISDSDINETAIPDLSQLAKVVDGQIVNLVAIGTKIQNQPSADDKLKREMPEACEMGLKPPSTNVQYPLLQCAWSKGPLSSAMSHCQSKGKQSS